MPVLPTLTQELHAFPVPVELEGANFVDLSRQARDRFLENIAVTPLERSEMLSYGDNDVYIKRADQLPGGNFKSLSATNTIAGHAKAGHDRYAFATAGSYGIGIGYATDLYGGRPTAFVPEGSSQEKWDIMQALGVEVIESGSNFDQANEHARQYAEEHSSEYIHPFASVANLAGTGVLGLELDEQSPEMTHVVLQFGGGSLVGGVGSVIKQLRPEVHIETVQVAGCSPFVDSVRSGEIIEAKDRSSHIMPSYFARLGGVGVGKTHPLTLGVGSRAIDTVGTIWSRDVYATMHDVREESGVLPEFAAAVSLEGARQLARSRDIEGATIVAVLTGNHADEYREGYLEGMSAHRQQDQ
jgi:threonine dehydratase